MKILLVENEDNAVVCVKIIIDLHRSFRQVLEDQVQPFLDIVQEIFQNMEQTVHDSFDNPDQIATVNILHCYDSSIRRFLILTHFNQNSLYPQLLLDQCHQLLILQKCQQRFYQEACIALKS